MSGHGFTYTSPTKGTFHAVTSDLTAYLIKGSAVQASSVAVGSHVGVHGYLHGASIKAVEVTIYPSKKGAKPKERTYRGVDVSAGETWVNLSVGARAYHFDLAPGAAVIYRYLPVSLAKAKPGERVDVRGYLSGSKWLATRVQLLVIHVKHPRTVTIYGLVQEPTATGFSLQTTTGQVVSVFSALSPTAMTVLSVHGWAVNGGFHASKLYHIHSLPGVHTTLVRGTVRSVTGTNLTVTIGGLAEGFVTTSSTHLTYPLSAPSHVLKPGLYISVRFWSLGSNNIVTSIHIYKSTPIPSATGEVKGVLIAVHGNVLTVGPTSSSTTITVPSLAKIRDGAHAATFGALAIGQTISVRYYDSGSSRVATSIHIYVSGKKTRTRTGTILSLGATSFQLADRGVTWTVAVSPATRFRLDAKTISLGALKVGMRVRVTGSVSSSTTIAASRIDILPPKLSKTGHLPTSFRGVLAEASAHQIQLTETTGRSVTVKTNAQTKVLVHNVAVPMTWLFGGPTVSVAVSPGPGSQLVATQILFHPTIHSLTGNVLTTGSPTMEVQGTKNQVHSIDITVASFTDDSKPSTSSALQPGLRVHIEGFQLPAGDDAALTVAITHPTVHMSGVVAAVSGQSIEIRRTSGALVSLEFPSGVTAFSAKTNQSFVASEIPAKSSLGIRGTQEAGYILVSSATLTLKSALLHGTVATLPGSTLTVTVTLDTGQSAAINTAATTKITIGHEPAKLSDLEVGDKVSIRAYPDVSGGYLATSLDIQRTLKTRTGLVSDVSASFFVLIGRTSAETNVAIHNYTEIIVNGLVVSNYALGDGTKVKVEGHMRPDGTLDATKITVES